MMLNNLLQEFVHFAASVVLSVVLIAIFKLKSLLAQTTKRLIVHSTKKKKKSTKYQNQIVKMQTIKEN